MKKKYTKDELNEAINSINASHKTKLYLEKRIPNKYEKVTAGYISLIIGIVAGFCIFFFDPCAETIQQPWRFPLIFSTFYMIGFGTMSIQQTKVNNVILDLVMSNK